MQSIGLRSLLLSSKLKYCGLSGELSATGQGEHKISIFNSVFKPGIYYFNYLCEMLLSGLLFPLNSPTVKTFSGNRTALALRRLYAAVYLAILDNCHASLEVVS